MAAVQDFSRMNGIDRVPRPFVIGVAGGTASGKVTEGFRCCQAVKILAIEYVLLNCLLISDEGLFRILGNY